MANLNPTRYAKAKVAPPPDDREQRMEMLAEMVVTAAVLYRQAEGVLAEAVLVAAKEMTADEHEAVTRSVAEATRPYSEEMIRRIVKSPEVFGCLTETMGASR